MARWPKQELPGPGTNTRNKKDHLSLVVAWMSTWFAPEEISFGLYKGSLILVLGLSGWLAANCFLSTSEKY